MEAKRTARPRPEAKSELPASSRLGLSAVLKIGLYLVVLAAALWLVRPPRITIQTDSVLPSAGQGDAAQDDPAPSGSERAQSQAAAPLPPSPVLATAQAASSTTAPVPTPESRGLVASLVHLETGSGVLTEQQASAWKQNLQELIKQGPAGVAAIQEFMAQNREYNFGPGASELLGFGSARTALIGALAQIGGPEALNALRTVLQTTALPAEIALLAQTLETLEPGQHGPEVLDAVRQTLEMATTRKVEMPDAAPLFEVLQRYGGPDVAQELMRASGQWNYYSTIALAQLPDDAGIPSLIQIAQDSKTSATLREAAEQMLAQVSDHSADARTALLAVAHLNQVSPFTWQMIGSSLAGDQVGLLNSAFEDRQGLALVTGLRTVATSDNQKFFAVPVNLTAEQASQRLAFVDELLATTSDPAVTGILNRSKDSLRSRLSQPPLAAAVHN